MEEHGVAGYNHFIGIRYDFFATLDRYVRIHLSEMGTRNFERVPSLAYQNNIGWSSGSEKIVTIILPVSLTAPILEKQSVESRSGAIVQLADTSSGTGEKIASGRELGRL